MSVRLFAMTCGYLTMRADFFLAGELGMLAIPITSYLIKHPKGTVLFDTGLSTQLQSKDGHEIDAGLGTIVGYATPTFSPGEEVAGRLIEAGIDPAKIDIIINSHLHFDHCGGNALIPNARLIIQKREWQASKDPETQVKNHFNPKNFDLGHDRQEVDGEHDVFGDGTIVCVPTYGHTPGHQSLRVRLEDGEVVLTADACYMRKSLERMQLPIPLVVSDPELMLSTFKRFKAMQDAGAFLLFGHDCQQMAKLNAGPLKEITRQDLVAEAAAAA